jgi:inosose dehydratase
MLELTDVGLLLDTGHLALGGGDPVQDCATGTTGSTTCTSGLPPLDPRLGDRRRRRHGGGLAPQGLLRARHRRRRPARVLLELASSGYSGWLVVEQDPIPAPDEDASEAIAAQARNRRWLIEVAGNLGWPEIAW